MVNFFIGVGDGNRELLNVPAVLEPLEAPAAGLNLGTGALVSSGLPTGSALAQALVADDFVNVPIAVVAQVAIRVDYRVLEGDVDSIVLAPIQILTHLIGITTSFDAGAIFVAPVLDNGLALAVIPIPSPDLFAELNDDKRPCLPWQVVRMNVGHIFDLTEDDGATYKIANNVPFVVSNLFNEDPDDPLLALGGKRNYLGIILDDGMGGKAVRFRPPYAGEVIYNLDTANPLEESEVGTFKFNAETEVWVAHITFPQRSFNATRAFGILDPDGIWDYYANIVGLALGQHQYDTRRIGDLVDPARVPEAFLPLLLRNFGADDIFADSTFADQQEALRVFVALMKQKGTPESIVNALSLLGYSGHGSHVWAIPQGTPADDWTCKAFGYDNANPDPLLPMTEFFPTSGVCIHLNQPDGTEILKIDDGVKQTVAEFLVRNILPAQSFIRAFATDINVEGVTGAATGSVTIASGLNVADGDTVVLIDTLGQTVTFEFESAGGVGPGNIAVTIGIDDDASALNLAIAINAQNTAGNLDITAVATLNVVDLTQDGVGASGNTTVTVVGANLSKVDFTGGESFSDRVTVTDSLTITP